MPQKFGGTWPAVFCTRERVNKLLHVCMQGFWRRLASRPSRVLFGFAGLCIAWASASAQTGDDRALRLFRELDDRVSALKKQALDINRDLLIIEEESFVPPSVQVVVFVSLAQKSPPTLRQLNVKLAVDGNPVAHHLYDNEQIKALHRGGMHRIYLGSVAVGEHSLKVEVEGRTSTGTPVFTTVRDLDFNKGWEQKFLSVAVELDEKQAKPKLEFTEL